MSYPTCPWCTEEARRHGERGVHKGREGKFYYYLGGGRSLFYYISEGRVEELPPGEVVEFPDGTLEIGSAAYKNGPVINEMTESLKQAILKAEMELRRSA